jgi:hypothetical protein
MSDKKPEKTANQQRGYLFSLCNSLLHKDLFFMIFNFRKGVKKIWTLLNWKNGLKRRKGNSG